MNSIIELKRSFFKDLLISNITNGIATLLLGYLFVYICTHIESWTHHFAISYTESFLFCLGLAFVFFLLFCILQLIALGSMRLQYHFHELEEGKLRQQIWEFCKESKKKYVISKSMMNLRNPTVEMRFYSLF